MKRIIFILLALLPGLISQAQFGNNQSSGTANTLVHSNGAYTGDSGIVLMNKDTAASTKLSYYNGQSGRGSGIMFYNGRVYIRNSGAWQYLLSSSSGWNILGNAGTTAASNFFGTTDSVPVVSKTNNTERMRITATGNVGIGIASPSFKLDVGGTAAVTDRKIGINGFQMLYYPDQSSGSYLNSIAFGDGLQNLSHVSDQQAWNNTAVGIKALYANTTGNNNTAVGIIALQSNTIGTLNSAFGAGALAANISGTENSAFGQASLTSNTTGDFNTAYGANTLLNNTTGQTNTAIGGNALRLNSTGLQNTAVGYRALDNNLTGFGNSADGYRAMQNNTLGFANSGFGLDALGANSIGTYNSAIGFQAGLSNDTGHLNVYVGANSGNNPSQKVNARYSVALGAGSYTTANYQLRLSDSLTRLTMLGLSRGTAGYVLTDSLGDGQYWVARPVGAASSLPLSSITAATGTNTINNGANQQTWNWNTLASGYGLSLTSNSIVSSSAPSLLNVEVSGANASSGQTTYAVTIGNGHSGATSTTIGLAVNAVNGTNNTAILATSVAGIALDLGVAGASTGKMRVNGSTSGSITIQPASAAGTWTMTLPTTDGNSGEFLQTDGSGITSWAAASTVATSVPLSGITAATIANGIDNGSATQLWEWNGITSLSGLTVSTSSISTGSLLVANILSNAASGNSQTAFFASNAGANTSASQTTYGMRARNIHTGTTSTNIGGEFVSSGGTVNIGATFSGTQYAALFTTGSVGIGTSTPVASALLEVSSTTQGVKFPTLTTTQQTAISSPATGLIIWNSDSLALCTYNGSAWLKVSQGSGGSGVTTVGTFSGSSQTNGASISGSTITFGPADVTNPGMMSTGTQTLTGAKTFQKNVTVGQSSYVAGMPQIVTINYDGSPAYGSKGLQLNDQFNGGTVTMQNITNKLYVTTGTTPALVSSGGFSNPNSGSDLVFGGASIYTTTDPMGIQTNAAPHASASLEVKSTTRGFLPPRMTGALMNAISSPATGLMIYNTDSLAYCTYNGTVWRMIATDLSTITIESDLGIPIASASGNNITLKAPVNSGTIQFSTLSDSTFTATVRDTTTIASFGAGSTAAGDTLAFTTSAVYGSYFNNTNDTVVVTRLQVGLQGTNPSVLVKVWYNDSLNVTAGATALVTAGNTCTNIYTGTSVTSFDNTKIPPGVWVWVATPTVTTKPKYFSLSLIGYKKKNY